MLLCDQELASSSATLPTFEYLPHLYSPLSIPSTITYCLALYNQSHLSILHRSLLSSTIAINPTYYTIFQPRPILTSFFLHFNSTLYQHGCPCSSTSCEASKIANDAFEEATHSQRMGTSQSSLKFKRRFELQRAM